MASPMQKRAAKAALENLGKRRPRSKGAIVKEAGYPPSIQKNPAIVFESKGFKEALAEYGLTDELVVGSLVKDIKRKHKGNRYNELNLGAEILGLKKGEKGDTQNNFFFFNDEQRARIARRVVSRNSGGASAPH